MTETTNTWETVTEKWETVAETWTELGKQLGYLVILLPLAIIGVIVIVKAFRYFLRLKYEAEETQRERELEKQKPILDYLAKQIAQETAELNKEQSELNAEIDIETQELLNKIERLNQ